MANGLDEKVIWVKRRPHLLQARYDFETDKDKLEDRLEREVHVYAAAV